MKPGDTVSVLLDGNRSADLQVEERVPYDPSAYQYETGWACWDMNTDTSYFVSEGGDVYVQPENRVVGVAPAVKEAADRLEAQTEEALARSESDYEKRYYG